MVWLVTGQGAVCQDSWPQLSFLLRCTISWVRNVSFVVERSDHFLLDFDEIDLAWINERMIFWRLDLQWPAMSRKIDRTIYHLSLAYLNQQNGIDIRLRVVQRSISTIVALDAKTFLHATQKTAEEIGKNGEGEWKYKWDKPSDVLSFLTIEVQLRTRRIPSTINLFFR